MESYIDKQDVIHKNAKSFNEDCERFDSALEAFKNDVIPQSAWDSIVPSIAEENAVINTKGFQTIQVTTEKEEHDDTIVTRHPTNVQLEIDPLSRLYAKVACTHMMTFWDYCSRMWSLNRKQCEIVMYNRAWCKSYIDGMWHGQKLNGYRVFLSGCGGTGKSHVLKLIQQDMCYMLNHTINPNDDQPLVLVPAPTGSAAFQMGGSTIYSAFFLYDKSRTKPNWEKCSIMQLKLQKLMLSITDEISMVSFKQYQQMNEIMCIVKGTCNGNWGDICVLAAGDLYQLPPGGQSPIYISPHTAHTLDDFAPNGWEDIKLHGLKEIMRQKDVHFAQNLNKIWLVVLEEGSEEDRMLQGCELKVNEDDDIYPKDVAHVCAQNQHCDEWNNKRITSLQGDKY